MFKEFFHILIQSYSSWENKLFKTSHNHPTLFITIPKNTRYYQLNCLTYVYVWYLLTWSEFVWNVFATTMIIKSVCNQIFFSIVFPSSYVKAIFVILLYHISGYSCNDQIFAFPALILISQKNTEKKHYYAETTNFFVYLLYFVCYIYRFQKMMDANENNASLPHFRKFCDTLKKQDIRCMYVM